MRTCPSSRSSATRACRGAPPTRPSSRPCSCLTTPASAPRKRRARMHRALTLLWCVSSMRPPTSLPLVHRRPYSKARMRSLVHLLKLPFAWDPDGQHSHAVRPDDPDVGHGDRTGRRHHLQRRPVLGADRAAHGGPLHSAHTHLAAWCLSTASATSVAHAACGLFTKGRYGCRRFWPAWWRRPRLQ